MRKTILCVRFWYALLWNWIKVDKTGLKNVTLKVNYFYAKLDFK